MLMQMADLGAVQLHYRIDGEPDGAPVGLMLMMPAGNDARLFSVAAAVEAAVGLKPA